MKKLRLTLDHLRVESFPTAPEDETERGTVHGREMLGLVATPAGSCYTAYGRPTCLPNYTCPECADP